MVKKKLYSIFDSLGFSYIAESNCSIKALLPNIKQRLIDQCTQAQSSKICSSTKLKFYPNFYDFIHRSAYVNILRNKTERSILCKIRLRYFQMSKDVPKILYKKMGFLPIKVIFQVLLGMQHLMLFSEPLKFLWWISCGIFPQ
jgi:hypothetical protein